MVCVCKGVVLAAFFRTQNSRERKKSNPVHQVLFSEGVGAKMFPLVILVEMKSLKRLIVSFLFHYDLTQLLTRKQFILCISWTVNQLISRVEKYNTFPEGFVTNTPPPQLMWVSH